MKNIVILLLSFIVACSTVPAADKELMELFQAKQSEQILELLERGSIPLEYQTRRDGFSLLHLSVVYNNIDLLGTFIEQGVPLDVVSKNGNTPLILAIERGEEDLARIFIEDQADLNIVNHSGDTALILTAKKKMYPLMIALIKDAGNRVDPFLKDSSGKRALEYLAPGSQPYDILQKYEKYWRKHFSSSAPTPKT